MKAKYRFRLRTFSDPPEYFSGVWGPFEPEEAARFAQTLTQRHALRTGRPWVCDYGPARQPMSRLALATLIIAVAVAAGLLILWSFL